VTYPYKLEGVMKSILQKNQAVVIHEDFGENIAIELEVEVTLTDAFIESVKELSSGNAQIIIED
jgi:putative IMPACT (imprinted ancient) family translation regulator